MFGLGTTELIIIAFVIVLLFGGKRLPQLGRSMGSAITNFKKGLNSPKEEDEKKKENQDQA
ncbi:MAG: twin-arginine translocase TatA/TatE family subunit [Bacteriovoracaceae bacterium]